MLILSKQLLCLLDVQYKTKLFSSVANFLAYPLYYFITPHTPDTRTMIHSSYVISYLSNGKIRYFEMLAGWVIDKSSTYPPKTTLIWPGHGFFYTSRGDMVCTYIVRWRDKSIKRISKGCSVTNKTSS